MADIRPQAAGHQTVQCTRSFSLRWQVRPDVQQHPQSYGTVGEHIINRVQANDMAGFVYANVMARRPGNDAGTITLKIESPPTSAAFRQ